MQAKKENQIDLNTTEWYKRSTNKPFVVHDEFQRKIDNSWNNGFHCIKRMKDNCTAKMENTQNKRLK